MGLKVTILTDSKVVPPQRIVDWRLDERLVYMRDTLRLGLFELPPICDEGEHESEWSDDGETLRCTLCHLNCT